MEDLTLLTLVDNSGMNEGLKNVLIEVGALTTYLQSQIRETLAKESEEIADYIDQFKSLPDAESIAIMEKNMIQVMKLVHALLR